jgi:hypothetical protein
MSSIKLDMDLLHNQLGMTQTDYEECFMREIEFIQKRNQTNTQNLIGIQSQSSKVEDKYHADVTYLSETSFIELNLSKLQYFLTIPDIKPIGKCSYQIIYDSIYRGCKTMGRDTVNEIMKCYKVIDVKDVYSKFTCKYGDYSNQNDESKNSDEIDDESDD